MSRLVTLALLFLLVGCATPQRIPAATCQVRVVDDETGAPVAGAHVRLAYEGVRDTLAMPPAVTDRTGQSSIEVPAQHLRTGFGEVFFAGGYLQQLSAEADGYETKTLTGPPQAFSDQPVILSLRSIRNRFGAVRVVDVVDQDAEYVLTTFEVLDGPRAGSRLRLPMFPVQRSMFPVGSKFYLRVPVDVLEKRRKNSPNSVFQTGDFLRGAVRDEPYAPPLK